MSGLTGGDSDVDKVLDVVGLALAQLLSVDPLRHKHAPGGELRVVERNHNLFARRIERRGEFRERNSFFSVNQPIDRSVPFTP